MPQYGPTHAKTIEELATKARQALDSVLDRLLEDDDDLVSPEQVSVRIDAYEALVKLHRESCARDGGDADTRGKDQPGLFSSTTAAGDPDEQY